MTKWVSLLSVHNTRLTSIASICDSRDTRRLDSSSKNVGVGRDVDRLRNPLDGVKEAAVSESPIEHLSSSLG
jgi:hypothetical protein